MPPPVAIIVVSVVAGVAICYAVKEVHADFHLCLTAVFTVFP